MFHFSKKRKHPQYPLKLYGRDLTDKTSTSWKKDPVAIFVAILGFLLVTYIPGSM